MKNDRDAVIAYLRQGGDYQDGNWYPWDRETAGYASMFANMITNGGVGRDPRDAEREACIHILEDMRPRNAEDDWNEFTVTADTILRLAIEAISRRKLT